jgi:serine/tyrosine/threonine adenylyltransferase
VPPVSPASPRYRPAPRFADLGEGFADVVAPARFPRHVLRFRNQRWAERVGLGALDEAAWERCFARFEPLEGNLPAPLALRYHGHQFGVYNPRLGDGRGFLYAQIVDPDDGRLLDLGTKGSGETPWSRGGDGRLTLQGGVREVLASEMLEALGVPTAKTFSLFETGEGLYRGDEPSPARSTVLVRLAHSHLRFGTFQRYAHLGDHGRLAKLFDFAVANYHPGTRRASREESVVAFLGEVARRAGELAAAYLVAGFVHGVLNTDNLNITGESFDYGPYRFVLRYDLEFVAAYFDETGLYAFGRQPRAILWAVGRLAEALSPLCPETPLAPAIAEFRPAFAAARERLLLERLGVAPRGPDHDPVLVEAVFAFLEESLAPYDQVFFDLHGGLGRETKALAGPAAERYQRPSYEALRGVLTGYRPAHPERLELPYFQGDAPCSLIIDEVRALWDAIATRDDWGPFDAKVEAIRAFGATLAPRG